MDKRIAKEARLIKKNLCNFHDSSNCFKWNNKKNKVLL